MAKEDKKDFNAMLHDCKDMCMLARRPASWKALATTSIPATTPPVLRALPCW